VQRTEKKSAKKSQGEPEQQGEGPMGQLAAGGAACLVTLIVAVLAMIVLGIRDASRNRAFQESRPLEDRIRDFRDGAAMWVKNLERIAAKPPRPGRNLDWIPPAIDLFKRMEQIAESSSSTAEESMALASDARQYESEHRVKGLFISGDAERLAALLERRGHPPNSGIWPWVSKTRIYQSHLIDGSPCAKMLADPPAGKMPAPRRRNPPCSGFKTHATASAAALFLRLAAWRSAGWRCRSCSRLRHWLRRTVCIP
jgi:hypothetical protein